MRPVPTSEDLVETLLERARQSANAASLARTIYKQRGELQHALVAIRRIESSDAHHALVQAFVQVLDEARDDLAHVTYRTDLLREWHQLLIDTIRRVEVGEAPATSPRPFHELLDDEDLEIMEIDRREDSDLGARGIAEAWQA
jgi:hypothetical protein